MTPDLLPVPKWQAGDSYLAGMLIRHHGTIWRCQTGHRSEVADRDPWDAAHGGRISMYWRVAAPEMLHEAGFCNQHCPIIDCKGRAA